MAARTATLLVTAIATLLLWVPPADAIQIPITSFENGELIPSGGDTVGEAIRRRRLFGVFPTDGGWMFMASTQEADGATDTATIETAMGIPSGTIDGVFATVPSTSTVGPTNGSAFQITFSAQAGDELLFDWNFVTREALPLEPLYTDFGWGHLSFEGTTVGSANIGNANTGPFFDTGNNNYDQTDWQSVTVPLASTGSYTVTLGVMDVEDAFVDSFMLFDWFRIRRVPEPNTFLLVAMGLLGLAWQGRHSRTQRESSAMSAKRSGMDVRPTVPANSR